MKNSVNIGKEIYIDKEEKRLRIKVNISVNSSSLMKGNEQVIGYSISIEPTRDTEDRTITRLNCNPNSCHVHQNGFMFNEFEVYKITVLPVTRSMLKKYPNLQNDTVNDTVNDKLKATFEKKMDTFQCKRNGTLVEIKRSQLCNSEKDCDADGGEVGIDERPQICRGKVANTIQQIIFLYAMFFLVLLLFFLYNFISRPSGQRAGPSDF